MLSTATVGFIIKTHERDAIIEVVYPAHPTAADVDEYAGRIKAAIDAMHGPWSCLVDQRKLQVMDPDLVNRIAALNAYASPRGMRRAARVVTNALSRLQSSRVMRESAARAEFKVFESRDDALAWLRLR